jgi:predicted Zn-dependent protease
VTPRESELCERVLEVIGTRAEAIVTVASARQGLTRFANSFIHQKVAEDVVHIALRATVDARSATATTTDTSAEGIGGLVDRTIAAARLRPPDPYWPGLAPRADAAPSDHFDSATADASPAARAEQVGAFIAATNGLECAGFCATDGVTVALGNSAGARHHGRHSSAHIDGIARTATADGSASQLSSSLEVIDGAAAGSVAAAKARASADPVDIDPGIYEVVLEPTCVASMLDFLAYAGFNAKAHGEGRSFAHLGEQQFDASVTMWDDATDARSLGVSFDAEGTPKRPVELVTGGTTTGLAHDRRTALRAGVESTGHSSGDDSAGPVPVNMILGGGDRSLDELVASVTRGLLVTEFHYIRILDPKTQVCTGITRNGLFLIEGGEVTKGVKNLRFTQSFVSALGPGKVLGVGNDSRLTRGHLGQLLGNSHIVPSLHLAAWNFTGGAKG